MNWNIESKSDGGIKTGKIQNYKAYSTIMFFRRASNTKTGMLDFP